MKAPATPCLLKRKKSGKYIFILIVLGLLIVLIVLGLLGIFLKPAFDSLEEVQGNKPSVKMDTIDSTVTNASMKLALAEAGVLTR